MLPVEAAIAYVERRGWPVFPRYGGRPLCRHGYKDATTDLSQIEQWWRRFPDAQIGCPTGAPSGLVVLDIDIKNGVNGFDTLSEWGLDTLPRTPMVHTPHGGIHIYFSRLSDFTIGCSVGEHGLGLGLDVKGERGSITLPTPRSLYRWDSALNLATCGLVRAPQWLASKRPRPRERDYGLVLDAACSIILNASFGDRHFTINKQCYSIGCMVAEGKLDGALARQKLEDAVFSMTLNTHGNMKKAALDLRMAFQDGLGTRYRRKGYGTKW